MPLITFPWAFAALAAAGGLAAVYLLRNRFRRHQVSSLFLWQEFQKPREGGARVQRIQTPWLFLVEMLIIIMMVLAATGPYMRLAQRQKPLVIVLDDSYSMTAGLEETPQVRAMDALKDELDRTGGAQVRFILAGPMPQLLGNAVTTWAESKRLLDRWHPSASRSDLSAAISLAHHIGGTQSRVLVVTDHAPPQPDQIGRLEWWSFGKAMTNLAITSAMRSLRSDTERLMIVVANPTLQPRAVTLQLLLPDNTIHHEQKWAMPAQSSKRLVLNLPDDCPTLTARLVEPDLLAVDNQVTLLPQKWQPVRVSLSVAGKDLSQAIEDALASTNRCVLTGVNPDLMITDQPKPNLPTLKTWMLQLDVPEKGQSYTGPYVIDRSHPLTEGLELAGVIWGAGEESAQSLPGRPVITAGNIDLLTDSALPSGRHQLHMRLREDLSTLTQSPAWPVLFWNLVDWRSRERPGLLVNNLRLNEEAVIVRDQITEPLTITGPDGKPQVLQSSQRRVHFPVNQVGQYTITSGMQSWPLSVNALSYDESDLSTATTDKWGNWIDDPSQRKEYYSVAWVLLALTLGLLGLHIAMLNKGGRPV